MHSNTHTHILALSFSFEFNPEEINRIFIHMYLFRLSNKLHLTLNLNRSLLLSSLRSSTSTMHTKAYRMLINPNKTMERKRCALSPIFNNIRSTKVHSFSCHLSCEDERTQRRRRRRKKKLLHFSTPPVCLK